MTPASPAGRRLSLFGCVLMTAIALLLPGCGDDGAATAGSATATQSEPQATAARPAAEPCPTKLGALVDSLDRLRRQLAIGLSYEQYTGGSKPFKPPTPRSRSTTSRSAA